MQDNVLSIRDLNIYFDEAKTRQGVFNVCFDIPRGNITALIGASGSGKSITSYAIMGLLPSNVEIEGSILFNNNIDLLALSPDDFRQYRGKHISMVFQEPMSALNPLMTCGQQLIETVQTHQSLPYKEAYDKVIHWLELVQLPSPSITFRKYPHQLSGGQKQRIMIAMAMINEPDILIADEPSTALDVIVQKDIVNLIKHLQASVGTTVIFITHDLALANTIADHIIEMKDGKVVPRSLHITEVNPKISYEINTQISILDVDKLQVDYPIANSKNVFTAVKDLSFQLFPGETLGIIGGSGSGKTTVSKAILGLVPIVRGSIRYNDIDLSSLSNAAWKKLRKDIQIIYQDPFASLNLRMRIGKAIGEPLNVHQNVSSKAAKLAVLEMLEAVGLNANDYDKYPHQFSGGQRQRISIARALILKPSIVICDESVAALDIIVRDQILELLLSLQSKYNLSYIFISHDMQVIKKICDRVIVMESGKMVEMNITKQLVDHPYHPYTKQLIAAIP